MDAKENFLSCLLMKEHEGVPTFIFDTSFGCSILGAEVSDIYKNGFDAELSARSISAGRRYLGHDAVVGATSCGDTRVFGTEVQFFPDRLPMIRKHAFSDPGMIDSHSPEEIDCPIIDGIAGSYGYLRELENDAFIMGYTPTPFLLSSILRGLEYFLMDLISGNGYVERLLGFSEKVSDIITEKICSTGTCDAVMLPGAFDNVDIIGINDMKRYCIPSLKSINRTVRGYGLPVIFHPHGALTEGYGTETLELFLGLGYDCIYYGEGVDHRRFNEITEGRCSMMGGIDTYSTIYLGPDERVVKDTEDVLEQTDDADFIFTCSCSVDAYLNRGRLKLMMDTVRKK